MPSSPLERQNGILFLYNPFNRKLYKKKMQGRSDAHRALIQQAIKDDDAKHAWEMFFRGWVENNRLKLYVRYDGNRLIEPTERDIRTVETVLGIKPSSVTIIEANVTTSTDASAPKPASDSNTSTPPSSDNDSSDGNDSDSIPSTRQKAFHRPAIHSCSRCSHWEAVGVCNLAGRVEKKHGARKLKEWLRKPYRENECSVYDFAG